jgi:hypothetical protein
MINDNKAALPLAVHLAQYKLDYFVRKFDLTTMQARGILARAGTSREKANAAALAVSSKLS